VKKIELVKLIRNWSKDCCVAKSTELGGTGNESVQDKTVESEPLKQRAVIEEQMEAKQVSTGAGIESIQDGAEHKSTQYQGADNIGDKLDQSGETIEGSKSNEGEKGAGAKAKKVGAGTVSESVQDRIEDASAQQNGEDENDGKNRSIEQNGFLLKEMVGKWKKGTPDYESLVSNFEK
jgi:hypothetical protein